MGNPMGNRIISLHIDTQRTWRGGEQQLLYLVRALKEMGSVPVVVCQPGSELSRALHTEGITFHEVNMRGELDIISAFHISRIIGEISADIVHAHTSHAHSMAVIAALFCKRRVKVVVSRRVDFRLKRNLMNKLKYKLPDKYISVSNAIKGVMVDCGVPDGSIETVHSGVDPDKFPAASKAPLLKEFNLTGSERIVGNIAHFADHKGQKYLIEAFAGLMKEVDNVKLFIVGHGELESALKKQAAGLGIGKSVIFPGFRTDIADFYKLFDVFVISSHLEGLCTAILDAMIMRTPVVATDAGGIPEIVKDGDTGRLVERKRPEKLKEAIKDVFAAPETAEKYAQNAYRFVCDNFDYRITAKKTFNVYTKLRSNE